MLRRTAVPTAAATATSAARLATQRAPATLARATRPLKTHSRAVARVTVPRHRGLATNAKAEAAGIEVVQPGTFSLVQDFPGRDGYGMWRVGVPPSGPMDELAHQLSNRLVGNASDAATLELTYTGPTLKFRSDTVIALTGAKMNAELDGKEIPMWQGVKVKAGQTLTIGGIDGAGARSYLGVAGGIAVEPYLGSKSTFPLGELGGPLEGRQLRQGDVLGLTPGAKGTPATLPAALVPKYGNEWTVSVLLGPQEAPEYFTKEDMTTFFNHAWEVSVNASRLGIRLNGPRPKFTRADGGEGGSHPSNLHDNAYAIGAVNFTGDHPVVLMNDGPSLGGFVCPVTIPAAEKWKLGQVKPGDRIKFKQINLQDAVQLRASTDELIATLSEPKTKAKFTSLPKTGDMPYEFGTRGLLKAHAQPNAPKVEYRMAGDRYVMVEYGDPVLDLNYRFRVHALEQWLTAQKVPGLKDTIPGVRSLLIHYDGRKTPLSELMTILADGEKKLPRTETMKVKSRIFRLPMTWKDSKVQASVAKYAREVRSEAPYLPENTDFIARNNGYKNSEEVRKLIYNTSYMVMGLGDVYLGAPCAVPLDPRQRLVVPKYNPARTYTPEGTVGIGGAYMCIYPMNSPGGYQLIGRTLPIWNTKGNLKRYGFAPNKPWFLDMFDQVRFVDVPEPELESARAAFARGDFDLSVQEETFDLGEYNKFVASVSGEVAELKKRQAVAVAAENKRDAEMLARARAKDEQVNKIIGYLAEQAVNGPDHPGAIGEAPSKQQPIVPVPNDSAPAGTAHSNKAPPPGLKQVFEKEGPKGFAKAVRANKGLLLTDTTWRDAHQSLLATRVRTTDLLKIAKPTSHVLAKAYSIECWGGATFDVALRFLHECPWDRLAELRQLVPNVPFQMLLRGANAVGYTSYPDNVVYKFCKQAKDTGMDVFRVFDSLNYVDNLKLGINAVGEAGGIVEAVLCYSGDVANPSKKKYTIDYYLELARTLVNEGTHVLCVKDMAGLLKPRAATMLIGALRREFPDVPIHVHTHDTAGTGVASMLACYEAGADAVDACSDAMSGFTSQPAMGAIVHNYAGTEHDTGIKLSELQHLTTYWEGARRLYAPFESNMKSAGADVYLNEIPGGQYTNMQFQAFSLGLAHEWDSIKRSYAEANQLLGDIVKVTPSSKVVGDLAQFMVANKLDAEACLAKAESINFPASVIECLQGYLGHPPGGFPEPFRSRVLKGAKRVEGRPGSSMPSVDFGAVKTKLEKDAGMTFSELDISSHVQYPAVFKDYYTHLKKFGAVTKLPTRAFLAPMGIGESTSFTEAGRNVTAKLVGIKDLDAAAGAYPVVFEVNGNQQIVNVKPKKAGAVPFIKRAVAGGPAAEVEKPKEKADKGRKGQVGAPMPGKVMGVTVTVGSTVTKGAPLVVLNAMKMETQVTAPVTGKVTRVLIAADDAVTAGDLLFEIQESK